MFLNLKEVENLMLKSIGHHSAKVVSILSIIVLGCIGIIIKLFCAITSIKTEIEKLKERTEVNEVNIDKIETETKIDPSFLEDLEGLRSTLNRISKNKTRDTSGAIQDGSLRSQPVSRHNGNSSITHNQGV